ncbi:MAG TPA: thioredoxin domain-containing protein [Longimicrobiales bacterium]|nr:thioredoxin domain-containing protein [Longimicrobiales bacterium]
MSSRPLSRPVGAEDHVRGDADAPVTVVEYGDFECRDSRAAHPIVSAIINQLGSKLRFAYRHFPLDEHPRANPAAQAAEAAGVQGKFWEMHDMLFAHQHALEHRDLLRYATELGLDVLRVRRELEGKTYAPRVRHDYVSGVHSGVIGTPTFFINGVHYDGDWRDQAAFVRALEQAAG